MGHTRWATHGGPTDAQRPPARRLHRPGRGDPQRDHRELRRSCGSTSRRAATSCTARPTPRSSPTCSRRSSARAPATSPRRCAPCAASSTARSRSSCRARRRTRTVVAARRNSPLVVGLGDGENFLGQRRRRVHRPHPRGAGARPGPGRRAARPTGSPSPTSTASPAHGRPFHVDWDVAAAEKGGYQYFMLKEIAEQPQAARRHACSAGSSTTGQIQLDEMRLDPQELRDVDKIVHRRLRHRVPRRADREVRDRALDPAARARSSWRASSATATRCSTATRSSSRSRSPARRWTR